MKQPNNSTPSDGSNRTEISSLGEFGLIDRIRQRFVPTHPSSVLGIGDDAAVILAGDTYQLVSTDMLVEGIHFDLSFTPLVHLGYKAVAVNVSDIAAMNGLPRQITVSLGLSNRFSVEAVDALYEGIGFACRDYGLDLVGGDTTATPAGLLISVTAIGTVVPDKLARRSGAQQGDILCVTGDLGGAYAGLQVLEREKVTFAENPAAQPQLDDYEYVVQRQLKPKARTDIIHDLHERGIVPTAMIDVSDGLASEVLHVCQQSKVGLRVYEDKLPVDERTLKAADEFRLNAATLAMNGGEDYELLFTLRQDDFERLKDHADIHPIGYVQSEEAGAQLATQNEQLVPIRAQGWNHFRT
jgi:thiamine-monophosphate kinase